MDYEPARTLREMADDCAAKAAEKEALALNATGAERQELKGRAKLLKEQEQWFRTRNGYE
jgi:hypothetical protein